MAAKHACPSCKADNPKRISEIVEQKSAAGVKSGLAAQYNPPRQPWAYLQGFLLAVPLYAGIMLSLTSPGESEASTAKADLLGSITFLSVLVGYGVWKNKGYAKKLEEWKKAVASKLHCLQCGHVFDS
jgi:hypothetical protein